MVPLDAAAVEASLAAWAEARCGAERVEVLWLGLAALPDGEPRWEGDPCRARPVLRVSVGEATLTVRPHLTVEVRVPVAAAAVARGEAVSVAEGLVPVESLVGAPVRQGVARRDLAAGEPLTTAVVSPGADGARGEAVELRAARGGLVVSAPGRLLQDARLGEGVRVVNEATGVALDGVLVAPGIVEIRGGGS